MALALHAHIICHLTLVMFLHYLTLHNSVNVSEKNRFWLGLNSEVALKRAGCVARSQ